MNDPSRWLVDADTSPELRELLLGAERPRELDEPTRARLGARVARLAVPVSLATWLGIKSAAAIGVAAGVVTAGAGLGITTYVEQQTRLEQSAAAASAPAAPRSESPPRDTPELPAVDPAPSLPPAELERARSAPGPAAPAHSGGLAEESLLLERARSALGGAPAEALTLAREHATRFPRGQLAAERSLVELEALTRLGRYAEAQARGERLLAAGGDDLYRARVQRLLEKIDAKH